MFNADKYPRFVTRLSQIASGQETNKSNVSKRCYMFIHNLKPARILSQFIRTSQWLFHLSFNIKTKRCTVLKACIYCMHMFEIHITKKKRTLQHTYKIIKVGLVSFVHTRRHTTSYTKLEKKTLKLSTYSYFDFNHPNHFKNVFMLNS